MSQPRAPRGSRGDALQIGEVAERTGLSFRTLRHYDEIGLVTPSSRSEGGFRLYGPADVDRLLVIRRMKPLGYALEDMRAVLDLLDQRGAGEPAGAAERADALLADARNRREKLVAQLAMADEFIGVLTEALGRD